MKNRMMIAGLMFALTALLGATATAAPKEGGGAGRMMRGLDMIGKALESVTDLSDAQKTDTKAILTDAEAQIAALRDELRSKGENVSADDRKAARQKVMEITRSARTEVEALLTDPQKSTFKAAFQAAAKEARGDAGGERGKKRGGKDKGGV